MQAWEEIIRTALLGTEKPSAAVDLSFVESTARLIDDNAALDPEEKFLQKAALVFNMRQAGVLPTKAVAVTTTTAPTEELPYCSKQAISTLNDIIAEESTALLELWMKTCVQHKQIVTPAYIPKLFDLANTNKTLRSVTVLCCGKRGEWLIGFNKEWNFSAAGSVEELWQTGTPDQRKQVLGELRVSDTTTANEWLHQSWPQEDANTKTSLLEVLRPTISEADIPFLESLQQEKSKKVKDTAIELLKLIPSSAIVSLYKDVLRQSIQLKKEKTLLGIMSKTVLSVEPGGLNAEIFKTGIEKLSKDKEVKDDDHVLLQLIASVPPSFLQEHLGLSPQEIIELMQKNATTKPFIPSLVTATVKFNDKTWAIALMQYSEIFYLDILPMIPAQQQEFHSLRFMEQHSHNIIHYATQRTEPWSLDFTRVIVQYTAGDPYQYNRQWYSKVLHLMHPAMVSQLGSIELKEAYWADNWNKMKDYINKLITLKEDIIKAFQPA